MNDVRIAITELRDLSSALANLSGAPDVAAVADRMRSRGGTARDVQVWGIPGNIADTGDVLTDPPWSMRP